MGKPLYVTLEAQMAVSLIKPVGEEYKSKTFGELVEKMTDGSVDEYNEKPYNAQEMQTANHVSDLLRQANSDPGAAQLYAFSKDEPPEEINVRLDDKVSDYNERILKIETIPTEGGGEKRFEKIELEIVKGIPGGNLCDLVMN